MRHPITPMRIAVVFLLTLAGNAAAFPFGITGYSGKSTTTCSACHSGGTAPVVGQNGPSTLQPGQSATYSVVIAGGPAVVGGFGLAAGTSNVSLTAGSGQKLANGELTHSAPGVFANGTLTFSFTVTAGSTPGPFTLYAAGVSANNADGSSGDGVAMHAHTYNIVAPAPTVSLTSPAAGSTFTAPATVLIAANATGGTIAKVDFYAGAQLIGTDTTSPYSFSWANVPAGSYALTAKATDSAGGVGTSAAVTITISAPPNLVPVASLTSPLAEAIYTPPATITLTALASDPDGTIAKVDFYAGTQLIGTDTTNPYSFVWSPVAGGSYTLTARATDNQGASGVSAAVNITVRAPANVPPTVAITAPRTGANLVAPPELSIDASAMDSDGTIAKVEFFNGSTLLGTDTTAPFLQVLSNPAAGAYRLTARATDNQGAMTVSAEVLATITPLVDAGVADAGMTDAGVIRDAGIGDGGQADAGVEICFWMHGPRVGQVRDCRGSSKSRLDVELGDVSGGCSAAGAPALLGLSALTLAWLGRRRRPAGR